MVRGNAYFSLSKENFDSYIVLFTRDFWDPNPTKSHPSASFRHPIRSPKLLFDSKIRIAPVGWGNDKLCRAIPQEVKGATSPLKSMFYPPCLIRSRESIWPVVPTRSDPVCMLVFVF